MSAWTEEQRQRAREQWTPGRREHARAAWFAWWESLTDEERQTRTSARWASFREHFPERAALIESTHAAIGAGGEPQPCDTCGDVGRPIYDWDAGAVSGWRCYPCRKAARA